MRKHAYNVFFTNLANYLKIDIILSLRKKEKSVSELVKDLKVEQSKLSHALASLKSCNIVNVKKKGKERIYSLNKGIDQIIKLVDEHAKEFCKRRSCDCEFCKK